MKKIMFFLLIKTLSINLIYSMDGEKILDYLSRGIFRATDQSDAKIAVMDFYDSLQKPEFTITNGASRILLSKYPLISFETYKVREKVKQMLLEIEKEGVDIYKPLRNVA